VTRIPMLDRKLLRDLWHLRGQLAAVAVVVACGIAVVMTTRTSYSSLLESRAAYYRDYRFADVFVSLKRAPEALRANLAAIPGVAAVDTRVVAAVTLDVAGLSEPATGRLVSVPERRRAILNDLHLRRGRWLEPGRRDEVIISDAFATANHLVLGGALGAVLNGRWQRLRIVGIAISPEYIYEIGEGGLFPDNRRFGVLWMGRQALESAFDMEGAFNDAALQLSPGTTTPGVIARVDALLRPYGGLGAYDRQEQVSARFINDEIAQNRVSGTVIPAVFLGVAAFLLNVVLGRLVNLEREQIGALKAFGYANWTVGRHYLKLALAPLLAGAVAGIVVGAWLAGVVNASYAEFYRFPAFLFRFDLTALALALLTTLLAAVAGAAGAVWRVVRLPPAAAMQPEPPARFRAGLLEHLGLERSLGVPARMIARSFERRPIRALLSVLGIASAVSILLVGRFFIDAIGYLGEVQFRHVQREDITVVFSSPRPASVRYELDRLPGVLRAEPFRSAPVRLRAGHHSRRVALLGLARTGELRQLLTQELAPVSLPPEGLLLTAKLAEILEVSPGDTLTVEVLEGNRATRRVVVGGTVNELIGLSAYMDRPALDRLLREAGTVSGAFLRTDPAEADALNDRLKHLPGVAGASSRRATLASFQATLARSIGMVTTVLIGFAGSLAVAMIYNTARIALSERARDLASLRVLGFTRGEVSFMLLGEQATLIGAGIAVGLLLGYTFCAILSGLYQWELFRIPLVLSAGTYVFAVTVVLAAGSASALLVRRRLVRLDLVAVLKSRE
jgi:putative ABC transport system permease protein